MTQETNKPAQVALDLFAAPGEDGRLVVRVLSPGETDQRIPVQSIATASFGVDADQILDEIEAAAMPEMDLPIL